MSNLLARKVGLGVLAILAYKQVDKFQSNATLGNGSGAQINCGRV
jgi:hypothetical protein